MKYLFIVQGEGRGHLTQAIALSQILQRNGHQVLEVLVGKCSNRELPSFFEDKIQSKVRTFDSPTIDYGKNGKKGKIIKSILINTTPKKILKWRKSMELIAKRIGKTKPDVIINFYEILAGLTNLVYRVKIPTISIAHQFLIEHPDYEHTYKTNQMLYMLRLNNILCSFGTTKTIALSFYHLKDYYRDRMAVLPPLLRQELFDLKPFTYDYILGYMLNSGYMDEVIKWHKNNSSFELHLFWDKKGASDCITLNSGINIYKINDTKFLKFMEGCKGYVTTAGFESICEAMYLGKPVMMIPVHLEQEINAADAQKIGAGITSNAFDISKLINFIPNYEAETEKFRSWVNSAEEQYIRHLTTLV